MFIGYQCFNCCSVDCVILVVRITYQQGREYFPESLELLDLAHALSGKILMFPGLGETHWRTSTTCPLDIMVVF